MLLRVRSLEIDQRVVWTCIAILAIVVGVHYLLTEPLIFEPGGWFALDGRRVLSAAGAWLSGGDPYSVGGFVYSPVAVVAASPLTLLPAPLVVVLWIAGSAVVAGLLAWRELSPSPLALRALGVASVLLFIPTIADLVLANVTVALVIASFVAARGTSVRSGIALGVLAAAFPKPLLGPIILWLVCWRHRPAIGAALGAALAVGATMVVTGMQAWAAFVTTIRTGAGINLDFVGNYGIARVSPPAGIALAIAALVVFLWLLLRRGPEASLVGATAAGLFIAPYTGIYAGLPMLVALPAFAAARPRVAAGLVALAIVTAPWSQVVAVLALATTTRWPRPLLHAEPEGPR